MEKKCKLYNIEIMYAYGSRSQEVANFINAEGSLKKKSTSDIDIGIKPFKGCSLSIKDKIRFIIECEDLFKVNKVDLVVLTEADPFLAANIIRGERLYCKNEYMTDEYELYILRKAGDLAHLERERINIILGEEKV